MTEGWAWWKENMSTILSRPENLVFIDEAQDLQRNHQAEFRTRLEATPAIVIFTTTHLHELDDALINRFGINVYELIRPTTDEVVGHMEHLCAGLGVTASRHQLGLVAAGLGCDMRKCVDFAHSALDQTAGGRVTDDYIAMVLGSDPSQSPDQVAPPKRRSKF